MLIAIDGVDGAGKTTLAQQLAVLLNQFNPIIEKEPTAYSEWGVKLRKSAENGRLSRSEEIEYFHKDRIYHIENVIQPALDQGRVVILDRYVDSTLAFQTDSPEEAERLYQSFLPEILVPDITFILDCTAETGLERIARSRQKQSHFEKLDTLRLANRIYRSRKGPTYVHLDATGLIEETFGQAVSALKSRFPALADLAVPSFSLSDLKAELG